MKIHTTALTLRVPKELLSELTKLAKHARQHRSTFVREILEKAVSAGLKRNKVFALVVVLMLLGGTLTGCESEPQQHITPSEAQFQKEYQEQQAAERAEREAFDRMSPLEKAKHLWTERGLSAANEAIAYLDQAPNSPEKQQLLDDPMPYVNQYRAEQLDQAKQRIAAQAAEEADIKADADATWKQQYYATRSSVHHPSHVFIEKEPHDCDWDKAPIGNKECHFEKQLNVHKSNNGANDAVFVTWAKVSN